MLFLTIDHVDKTYLSSSGQLQVLDNCSLQVARGEFIVMLGSSGCGKTTLLHILAGIVKPTSGQVYIDDAPIIGWSSKRTLVFQEGNLFPWLSAEANVAFGLRLSGIPRNERIDRARHLLRTLGLNEAEHLFPHQLSGGMQQRVALARALAVEPEVLLMDEPFGALDALTRSQLQSELLRIWNQRAITIMFVTHNTQEAVLLADRVIILSSRPGRITADYHINLPRPRNPYSPIFVEWERFLKGLASECPIAEA